MTPEQKSAALAAYRERNPPAGVYAMHCEADGQVWVGASGDLDKIANRHWFSLRMGSHPNAALQQAYNTHGPARLRFEVLDRLPADTEPISQRRLLADARDARIGSLGAHRL